MEDWRTFLGVILAPGTVLWASLSSLNQGLLGLDDNAVNAVLFSVFLKLVRGNKRRDINNKNTNKYQSIFLSAFWFTAFQAPARQPAAAEGKEETYYSSRRGHCSQACRTCTPEHTSFHIYANAKQVLSLRPCLYITLSQATEQKTKNLQFEAINIRSSELLA